MGDVEGKFGEGDEGALISVTNKLNPMVNLNELGKDAFRHGRVASLNHGSILRRKEGRGRGPKRNLIGLNRCLL